MTFRGGTEGVHQIVGLGIAAEMAGRRMKEQSAGLSRLRAQLLSGLRKLCPEVRVNEAPAQSQMPGIVNAVFPGFTGLQLLAGLDCYEVCVSIGSACTADRIEPSHVLLGMGLSEEEALSAIRISMGSATRHADIKYFLWALQKVLRGMPEGFSYLDPKHLTEEKILSDDTFIIDLRWPVERLMSPTIAGAKLWSHIGFEKRIGEVPRDKEVILMCGTGIYSFEAGYHLASAGHPRVRVVYGGYAAWQHMYPELAKKPSSP